MVEVLQKFQAIDSDSFRARTAKVEHICVFAVSIRAGGPLPSRVARNWRKEVDVGSEIVVGGGWACGRGTAEVSSK